MWLVIPVLLTAHVLVCLLMVAVTLMQLPRSEGLGAAFGGGVTENLFGAQTTNVLTKFTVWLGMAFFVITLLLAFAYANDGSTGSKIEKELLASPQPSAAPAASPLASSRPNPCRLRLLRRQLPGPQHRPRRLISIPVPRPMHRPPPEASWTERAIRSTSGSPRRPPRRPPPSGVSRCPRNPPSCAPPVRWGHGLRAVRSRLC